MARLKDEYENTIIPGMMEKFGYKNRMQVPRIEKIVINVGLGAMAHNKDLVEPIRDEIAQIAGQRPALTKAKKSIAVLSWIQLIQLKVNSYSMKWMRSKTLWKKTLLKPYLKKPR